MRATPILLIVMLLLTLAPAVEAAWNTSVSVPASFRPERTVTFSYTASSSSGADLPIRWQITLYTCQDLDADAWCELTDANRVDHGQQPLTPLGGASQTASWSVTLTSSEGAYRYHFHVGCIDNPCTGFQPAPAHNRTGAFQLAYTNTWTRHIVATNPTSAGSAHTVTYRLTSTSLDDPDLKGTATFYSDPPESPESDLGPQEYAANANTVEDVQWTDVEFPEIGTHRLRVRDTDAEDTTVDITVRGVHLHVLQPRTAYTEGARVSLYFTLEGHGSAPDPAPIVGQDIQVAVKNGTFTVATATARTDAGGRGYANISTPDDAVLLTWSATTSGAWLGIPYSITKLGEFTFTPAATAAHVSLEENVTAIRENLSDVRLKGVHLDEVGSRNAWMTSVRAAGAVAAVVLLILLVVFISFRV